jgi:hypothetical protein
MGKFKRLKYSELMFFSVFFLGNKPSLHKFKA